MEWIGGSMPRVLVGLSLLFVVAGCSNDGGIMTDDMGGGEVDLSGEVGPVDLWGTDFFQRDGIIVAVGDGGTAVCYITYCQGKVYQCGNCQDDDGDGLTDSMDPDCLGPCQNNEAAFYGSIPGQNNAPCKS